MRTFIDQTEVAAFKRVCERHRLDYSSCTIPNQTGIVQTVIFTIRYPNGDDISPSLAFELGREIESKNDLEMIVERIQTIGQQIKAGPQLKMNF
jgi:hypothetical protein